MFGDAQNAIFEQLWIPAKLVDYETTDHRAIGSVQYDVRSHERSYDMPTIDIADQHNGQAKRLGQSHVGDVVLAQIRFGRTSRAFYDHQLRILREAPITFHCNFKQGTPVTSVRACVERASHLAAHDKLCADVTLRLQENRVHVDSGFRPARLCLKCLCTPNLSAAADHRGVVRHVLGFERPHSDTALGE